MARPGAGTQIASVVLSDEQIELIDELAEHMGQSRSKMIAILVEQSLESHKLPLRFASTGSSKAVLKMIAKQVRGGAKYKKLTGKKN